MNILGVKFEERCFYISRDILSSVYYHLSCKPHEAISFLICIIQKTSISLIDKDIPKRQTPFLFFFESLLNKQQLFFIS